MTLKYNSFIIYYYYFCIPIKRQTIQIRVKVMKSEAFQEVVKSEAFQEVVVCDRVELIIEACLQVGPTGCVVGERHLHRSNGILSF